MEEVARVEVLTGLSGFLYSAGNVGGIVNSITIGNTGGQNLYVHGDFGYRVNVVTLNMRKRLLITARY